jgi:ubiquinone/menaquinone biosynthesis C-methylase UbiE
MKTELETKIFQTVANVITNYLGSKKSLILDLCCGTDLLSQMLIDIKTIEFTGVDINKEFLESAEKKTKNHNNFKYVLQDVIKYETDTKFDIVILTSAYHHITNQNKTLLLEKIFKFLKKDGILVIYEKLIKPYNNKKELEKNNQKFYTKRIEYLNKTESKRLNKKQYNALMNICALSASAEEEYKIDYNYIVTDLHKVRFNIIKEIKIWPKENLFNNEKVGDFVFVVKKT